MRALVPIATGIRGGPNAPAVSPRAIEKTSASSALDHGKPDANGERKKAAVPLQAELVCRDDTPRFDPFWYTPRLVPAFVAQLLGQIMPQRRASVRVETVYGRKASPRRALLLDRKS